MAPTKAELQLEIWLLRKRMQENQVLRQQVAINYEQLQDACDAIIATEAAVRRNLRTSEVPPFP